MGKSQRLLIAVGGVDGHRREYIALFEDIFSNSGLSFEVRALRLSDAFNPAPIFSPMLEEYTTRFMGVSILRALWGRRSLALMFRPGEAARAKTLKHKVKRALLRLARPLPTVVVATIMPFALDPSFADIADDWIHDPQLWDLKTPDAPASTPLRETLSAAADGRSIVAAIGAQNLDKGFDYFAELWTSDAELRAQALFVAAGKVAPASRAAADAFVAAGGLLIDRFISDEELLDLYGQAAQIWACYSPAYDQASGIFGRAVQTEKPTIVRQGAYMERLAELLGHPAIALPWGDASAAAALMRAPPPLAAAPGGLAAAMRTRSLEVLGRALGVDLSRAAA